MNKKIFAYILSFLIISIPFISGAAGLVPQCNVTGTTDTSGAFANPCDFTFFLKLINNIITFLLVTIATPFVALILCYVGWLYISDQGSSENLKKAKAILKNVVIGYIVALLAWLIIKTILKTFGFEGETFLTNYN